MKRTNPLWLTALFAVLLTLPLACGNDDDDDDTGADARVAIVVGEAPDPGVQRVAEQMAQWINTVEPDAAAVVAEPGDNEVVVHLGAIEPGLKADITPSGGPEIAMQGWGYRIASRTEGEQLIVETAGADNLSAQYAAYDLLERLGFLFYHPLETYKPEALDWSALEYIDTLEQPTYWWRGMHIHTMHPVEMTNALLRAGETNLERVKKYVDYLVANKQNYFQWYALRTVDFDSWIEHAEQIVDYAHMRGVRVGIVAPFVFRQQRSLTLVEFESNDPDGDIRANVDRLMAAGWDVINVEIGTSEFFPASDTETMHWMNLLSSYLAENYPGSEQLVKVHISTDQTAPNWGDINFNFLPGEADPNVGVMPHGVQHYDLYGRAPTYENENFHHMREFLLGEIGERRVLYYPETGYWVTFDTDVPVYLPAYIRGRWKDLWELRDSGMDGQINFTSGFEWGFWLHDLAAMQYAWQADSSYRTLLDRVGKVYGEAAAQINDALEGYIEFQNQALTEENGMRWMTAWDTADDIGHKTDIHAQPVRVRLFEIAALDADGLDAFEAGDLAELAELETHFAGRANAFAALEEGVPEGGEPFYQEILNGMRINDLRAQHMVQLYEASVAWRRHELGGGEGRGEAAEALFAENVTLREEILELVHQQETLYRWPDVDELNGQTEEYQCPDCSETIMSAPQLAGEHLTSYPFGYLMTTHTGYYFEREYKQAYDRNDIPMLMNHVDLIDTLGLFQ